MKQLEFLLDENSFTPKNNLLPGKFFLNKVRLQRRGITQIVCHNREKNPGKGIILEGFGAWQRFLDK